MDALEFVKAIDKNLTIVDFWANWCGPCRMQGPILDDIAKKNPNINVIKVDVDESNELASQFGIRSIPSILFVPMTGQPKMAVGALPKESIKEAINKELLIAVS